MTYRRNTDTHDVREEEIFLHEVTRSPVSRLLSVHSLPIVPERQFPALVQQLLSSGPLFMLISLCGLLLSHCFLPFVLISKVSLPLQCGHYLYMDLFLPYTISSLRARTVSEAWLYFQWMRKHIWHISSCNFDVNRKCIWRHGKDQMKGGGNFVTVLFFLLGYIFQLTVDILKLIKILIFNRNSSKH